MYVMSPFPLSVAIGIFVIDDVLFELMEWNFHLMMQEKQS